jgi:hypothetical protein
MNSKDATFAIYRNEEEIKLAIQSFLQLGFDRSELWAFQSKLHGAKDFSQVQKYQFKKGAFIGAVFGVLVGAFAMLARGELVANHWTLMILGVFAGGVLGAAIGTLVGIGTPDPAAKRYGQYLQSGGILLSVHSENPKQILQAQEILRTTGGQDIQLINELETWDKANLERIDLEKLQAEVDFEF